MSMVLVTGASGHLGASLVREALAEQHVVRALVRPSSDRRALALPGVQIAVGDLLDLPSLALAMEGCALVLHAGAVYRNWAADPDDILRPAVEGTKNVIESAAAAGVGRVVLTSSNAAVGYGTDPSHPLDETSWNLAPRAPTSARRPWPNARASTWERSSVSRSSRSARAASSGRGTTA